MTANQYREVLMADEQEEFEKKLAAEQAAGFKDRIENSPPIGAGQDGKVRTYKSLKDIPVHKLKIFSPRKPAGAF